MPSGANSTHVRCKAPVSYTINLLKQASKQATTRK